MLAQCIFATTTAAKLENIAVKCFCQGHICDDIMRFKLTMADYFGGKNIWLLFEISSLRELFLSRF